MSTPQRAGRAGMTLIELLVALSLLGLLAGVATTRVAGEVSRARFADSVARVQAFDRQARRHARRLGRPAKLTIEPAERRLAAYFGDQAPDGTPAARFVLELSGGASLTRGWTRRRGAVEEPLAVAVDPNGFSACYAARLAAPDGRVAWVLLAGGSTESVVYDDDRQAELGFRQLTAWRL